MPGKTFKHNIFRQVELYELLTPTIWLLEHEENENYGVRSTDLKRLTYIKNFVITLAEDFKVFKPQ